MTVNSVNIENIEREFRNLSGVAPQLNEASDAFNNILDAIESRLKKLNIGIEVCLPLDSSNTTIGYKKISGNWHLVVIECSGPMPHGLPDAVPLEWPVKEAPRRLRVYCVNRLEELLAEMANQAVKATGIIREQVKTARGIVEAMRTD